MRLRGDDGDVCNGTLQQKNSTENSSWVSVPYRNGSYIKAEADDTCSKLNCGKSSSVTQCNGSEICLTCTDRVKVELEFSCYGNVYVRLNDTVHTVCSDGMTKEAQERMGEVVCQQLNCGEILSVSWGSELQDVLLRQVDCSGQEDSLWECLARYGPGQPCQSTARVSCAGWRRLLLTDPDNACAGKVYARDQSGLMAVSRDGWGTDKGEELCKYLKCGQFSNYTEEDPPKEERNRIYNCSGTPKSILDCRVDNKTAQFQHLNIRCDGNPEVNLLGNCTGEVRINQKERMCGISHNTDRVLRELCHHLNCRRLITSWFNKAKVEAQYFSCTGHENRLWQCSSWKDSCDSVISVACANSVEFNFTGKCGGELQVRYRGNWEPVCLNSIEDAHVICRNQNCGKATSYKNLDSREEVQTSFECKDEETDPKSCVKYESCQKRKAIIYCEKHAPVENTGLTVGLMVGLLFLLVVTVVIWQRKRFLAILRLKPSGGDKDIELNSKEMQDLNENIKDDYEDVDPVMNPMEDESESQDDVSYKTELEVLDDYDDAMPAQAVVSETGVSETREGAVMLVGPDV
ncbi:hypothetical protein MHYP_G00326760 [Metynnis hypsauchen]